MTKMRRPQCLSWIPRLSCRKSWVVVASWCVTSSSLRAVYQRAVHAGVEHIWVCCHPRHGLDFTLNVCNDRFYPATPIQSPQAASSSSSTSYAVIVFGFPPDQATAVAQLFSSMGDVASLEPPPQGANWFQISYQNSWEAARAVRKSGEILGDHIMIGVRWAVCWLSSFLGAIR